MSVVGEFHRSDAVTGKEHRPTVVSRNGGTSSCSDDSKNEVGGDRVGRRRELAGSDRVVLEMQFVCVFCHICGKFECLISQGIHA